MLITNKFPTLANCGLRASVSIDKGSALFIGYLLRIIVPKVLKNEMKS